VHGGQKLWDYAAGSLVLEEAGGVVGSFEREDFWGGSEWRRSVVATHHPALYPAWRHWVDPIWTTRPPAWPPDPPAHVFELTGVSLAGIFRCSPS
jgi:hypothetical protein